MGNAASTATTTLNQWVNLNLNALAIAGSSIERFTLTNTTTGELTYNGEDRFFGNALMQMQVDSIGSAQVYQIRIIKNGSPTSDAIVMGLAVAGSDLFMAVQTPLDLVNGDTVRGQIRNTGGTRAITIKNNTMSIQ